MRGWLVVARGERTQTAVAKAVGLGQSYYSMIENGKRRPSKRTAIRIGRVLGVDWRRFFEGEEKSLKQHTKWPPRKGIGKNHPKRWRKEEGREAKGQKAGRQ